FSFLFFFFQAEDGIRDRTETGVQTCALPISRAAKHDVSQSKYFQVRDGLLEVVDLSALSDRAITYSLFAEGARTGTPLSREAERSEERRVGKECRARWWRWHEKENDVKDV